MASTADLQVYLYDKNLNRLGTLGSYIAVSGSLLAKGTGGALTFTVAANDPNMAFLLTNGTRVVVRLRGVDSLSGMVGPMSGALLPGGQVQFTVTSDRSILQSKLVWPGDQINGYSLLPGGVTLGGTYDQHGNYIPESGYASASGRTGIIVGNLLAQTVMNPNTANPYQFNMPLATDLPLMGRDIAASELPPIRFSTLDEPIQAALDLVGHTLTAVQGRDDHVVTFHLRDSQVYPALITPDSGIIQGGTWSTKPPTATRVVLGGPGEDVHRMFAEYTDATGLEAEYGPLSPVEVFKDATGMPMTYTDAAPDEFKAEARNYFVPERNGDYAWVTQIATAIAHAYLDSNGASALADGAPTASVSPVLAETPAFRFGGSSGIQLGDTLNIQAASGVTFTETVTEAKVTYTHTDGLRITPVVGDLSDDPTRRLAETIMRLARAQSRIARNR